MRWVDFLGSKSKPSWASGAAFLRGRTTTHIPDPEGGGHGCPPFSDLAMDGESENSRNITVGRFAPSGKALFFGSFLLGQQKK
jgi:hypothetical protein